MVKPLYEANKNGIMKWRQTHQEQFNEQNSKYVKAYQKTQKEAIAQQKREYYQLHKYEIKEKRRLAKLAKSSHSS